MSTLDEIGLEKQKIAERLSRLDAERSRLAEQLDELEVAERVLSRFANAQQTPRRRPGRPARAAQEPTPPPRRRGRRAAQPASAQPSVSDAVLQAVKAHPDGMTAGEVMQQLTGQFGLSVRPNHLGIALQRHRRAGRLEQRDERWYPPRSAEGAAA